MNLILRRLACVVLLVPLLSSTGAFAEITDLEVRLDPYQPRTGEPFQVLIEGLAQGGVTFDGLGLYEDGIEEGLEIFLLEQTCGKSCHSEPFRIEVDVPADLGLASGELQDLTIRRRAEAQSPDHEKIFRKLFAIVDYRFDHPMRPQVYEQEYLVRDNETVRLLIPSEVHANNCGEADLSVERMESDGRDLNLFLSYRGSIREIEDLRDGLEVRSLAAPDKCTPPGPTFLKINVLQVDLRKLEPGGHDIHLYLETGTGYPMTPRDPGTLPILSAEGFVFVASADEPVRLHGGRFQVGVSWKDFDGVEGPARSVPGATDESTLFTFFGESNWELLVKVLDGCALNDHYWVLGAAATTVEYTITISDTRTDQEWTYTNPLGVPSPAITDVTAFPCDVPF